MGFALFPEGFRRGVEGAEGALESRGVAPRARHSRASAAVFGVSIGPKQP